MDRNVGDGINVDFIKVALRKESVDRNRGGDTHANRYYVALRKESVDRNLMTAGDVTAPSTSLSARRAWIEISIVAHIYPR